MRKAEKADEVRSKMAVWHDVLIENKFSVFSPSPQGEQSAKVYIKITIFLGSYESLKRSGAFHFQELGNSSGVSILKNSYSSEAEVCCLSSEMFLKSEFFS